MDSAHAGVRSCAVDVGDAPASPPAVDALRGLPPLGGVFHLAGLPDDGLTPHPRAAPRPRRVAAE